MSSRRLDNAEHAAEMFWRPLAQRAGYDLQTAAQLLRLSVRQLERHCQRDLGCTPKDWFHRERMAHGARLLVDGQPAKVVALHLGYTQLANFSRDFKRRFGQSPTAYAPRPRLSLPPPPPA